VAFTLWRVSDLSLGCTLRFLLAEDQSKVFTHIRTNPSQTKNIAY